MAAFSAASDLSLSGSTLETLICSTMMMTQMTSEKRPETRATASAAWAPTVENCDRYFPLSLTSTGGLLGDLRLESELHPHGAHRDARDPTDGARVRTARAAVAVAAVGLVVRPL